MSNRVEELESTVRELQAAVDGLTEELVETRERLRQLEDAQNATADGDEPVGRADPPSDAHAERVDADGTADESATDAHAAEPPTDAVDGTSEDVASADLDTDPDDGAEADPPADTGSESDSGSDDDEIIVA
jgi:hypothetical protein